MPAQWMLPTGLRIAGPVPGDRAGAGDRDRAAASPVALRPVGLEVLARMRGLGSEVLLEVPEHGGAPVGVRHRRELTRLVAADEPEDDALRGLARRVVEGRVARPLVGHDAAVQAGVAPERLVVDGGRLDQRALRQPLGELVALEGKARVVGDPRGERGGDGDDHALRPHLERAGPHGDVTAVLLDAADRRLQQHPVAQLAGHLEAEPLRASGEAPHLRAVAGVEVALEGPGVVLVAGGGDVEEREQERELGGLGAEDRAGRDRDERAELGVVAVVGDVGGQRLLVPLRSARGLPGRVHRDIGRHPVEREDGPREVGQDRRVRGRGPGRALVAVGAPVALEVDVDVVAVVEGAELADAELLGEREDVVLGRPHEGGAALGDLAAADVLVQGTAADSLPSLEDED